MSFVSRRPCARVIPGNLFSRHDQAGVPALEEKPLNPLRIQLAEEHALNPTPYPDSCPLVRSTSPTITRSILAITLVGITEGMAPPPPTRNKASSGGSERADFREGITSVRPDLHRAPRPLAQDTPIAYLRSEGPQPPAERQWRGAGPFPKCKGLSVFVRVCPQPLGSNPIRFSRVMWFSTVRW